MKFALPVLVIGLATAASGATAAHAEMPEPVRAMIDAAIATGDPAKVRPVIDIARQTNPDDKAEIDALLKEFETTLAAKDQAKKAAEEKRIRNAGLFQNWSGKGELGAFRATGNTSQTGITAGLSLNRTGIDWRHKLTGRVDYQSTGGVTTREQFFARYEPNYKISDKVFAYALAQYERDRFQGFSGRYALSGGVGYQIIDDADLKLSAKTGPALRVTEYNDDGTEARIAALIGVDFDWNISDSLKLTHDTNAVAETGGSATVFIDSNNTSLNLVTGLNAKVSEKLTTRFSYAVDYDSNPPAGAVQTDTMSRVTLIYDF